MSQPDQTEETDFNSMASREPQTKEPLALAGAGAIL